MSSKKPRMKEMDLDAFVIQGQEAKIAKALDKKVTPIGDKITITGLFVDDSGSIQNAGLEQAMIDGVNHCLDALRGARGADFYLDIRGFMRQYYYGMLKDMTIPFGELYSAEYGSTPLVDHTARHYEEMRRKVNEYAARGVTASVAYAVFTDAIPREDSPPEYFARLVRSEDFIVGIGIVSGSNDKVAYRELFKQMGIKRSMTPRATASELRHAMNEFSRSVVAGAQR